MDITNTYSENDNLSDQDLKTDLNDDSNAMDTSDSSDIELCEITDEQISYDFGEWHYLKACTRLGVVPSKRVIAHLKCSVMQLRYRSIGPKGAEALSMALLYNSTVTELNLEENGLEGEGCVRICTVLHDNPCTRRLNLASNNVGRQGATAVGHMLQVNTELRHLDLSRNKLRDSDAESLAVGVRSNVGLATLDLSHNQFGEHAARDLGRSIGMNSSLKVLDLSWNQVRRRGAVTLCKGLARNSSLLTVNLSWNGLGYEGAVAVGVLLQANGCLRALDVSNNNINWHGAAVVAKGLRHNQSLQTLHIGHNPLTMTGCEDILEAVEGTESAVAHVGFDSIPVNSRVIFLMQCIQSSRAFTLSHGGLLHSMDVFGQRDVHRFDPLQLLLQFMGSKGIRPVELFRIFDKDKEQRISREQFVQGLRKIRAPLDNYDIQRVLDRLDPGKAGKISYQRLVKGVKDQIRSTMEEEQLKQIENERKEEAQRRIIAHAADVLPPISERSSHSITSNLRSNRSGTESVTSALHYNRSVSSVTEHTQYTPRKRTFSVRSLQSALLNQSYMAKVASHRDMKSAEDGVLPDINAECSTKV